MKKMCRRLTALLLTLIMAAMLVLPAMAYEDADPPIWQQWGYESMEDFMEWNGLETEEEYYEFIAPEVEWWKEQQEEEARWQQWRDEYLAANPDYIDELLSISPALWEEMEYESLEEFMEWNELETEEEYVDYLVKWYLYEIYHEERAAERMIEERVELGGPAEGIGVMWNGEFVQFPDAQPVIRDERTMIPVRAFMELVGAEVGFDNTEKRVTLLLPDGRELQFVAGETTVSILENDVVTEVEMDVAPYIDVDRTYVPVRFFSEALGLDVSWDSWYRTAIINDREALIAAVDARFHAVNCLLAPEFLDMEKSYEVVSELEGSISLYDSENGDKTASLSAVAEGIARGRSADLTAKLEMMTLLTLIGELAGFSEEDQELLEFFDSMEFECIVNAETGMVYVSGSILDKAYGDQYPDWQEGTWLAEDVGDLFDMIPEEYSMGALLYEVCCEYASIYDLQNLNEAADALEGFIGDKLFVEADGGWELVYDLDDIALLYEATLDAYSGPIQKAEFRLRIEENGAYSAFMEMLLDDEEVEIQFLMDMSCSEDGAYADVELHVKDQFSLVLTETESFTETDELPRSAPPEGATVITEEELLFPEPIDTDELLPEENLLLALMLMA